MIRLISVFIIIATLTTWLIYRFPKTAISPGDLLTEHRQLENNCLKCHTLFLGVSGEKCLSCHVSGKIGLVTVDGQQIRENSKRVLFHNNLGQETCTTCHEEHQGITNLTSITRFSHQLLKPEHQKDCVSCHTKPNDSIHINNSQACNQCHKTTNWNSSKIDHRNYFRFDKNHTDDCKSCHPSTSYSEYTCYNCHEHSQQKIEREHVKEGIRNYENCVECHPSGNEHDTRKIRKIKSRVGESVLKKNTSSNSSTSTNLFLHQQLKPEELKDCINCHKKPIDSAHNKASENCFQCHTTKNWTSSTIDHREYFRFDKHHSSDCESCHPNANYSEYTCYNCHEHSQRKIRKEHVEEGIRDFENCVTCHRSGDEDEAKRNWKEEKSHSDSKRIYKKDSNYQRSKKHISKKERNKDKKHSDDDEHDDNDHD